MIDLLDLSDLPDPPQDSYKLWVAIEHWDAEKDEHNDVEDHLPFSLGEFPTLSEAYDHLGYLLGQSDELDQAAEAHAEARRLERLEPADKEHDDENQE